MKKNQGANSRFQIPDSWFKVPGSRFQVSDSRFVRALWVVLFFIGMMPCFAADLKDAQNVMPDTSRLVSRTNLSSGTLRAMKYEADSLFHLKQYTQSLELYQAIFNNKSYSPSMLLKLAYIQEGLGHLAQSMYFLNLYYIVSHDPQALAKLEDVAAKNRLEGYAGSDAIRFVSVLRENYNLVVLAIGAVCILLLALIVWNKLKRNRRNLSPALVLLFFLCVLFAHTYFNSSSTEGIISNPATYLMEGPSAGSSVVSIVGEGHRLEILGRKDVWLRVRWTNREVFVKETEILPVRL